MSTKTTPSPHLSPATFGIGFELTLGGAHNQPAKPAKAAIPAASPVSRRSPPIPVPPGPPTRTSHPPRQPAVASSTRVEPKATSAKKPAKKPAQLTSGELNGIEWSEDETRQALYDFARDQELDVRSRDSKPDIIKALSKATKAQA